MGIFSKKKLLKDRRAGLAFHWRSSGNRNTLGYCLAFLCATVASAILLYGVKIETPNFSLEERIRVKKIVFVDEMDPQVRLMGKLEAPFPEGWDPANDEVVEDRLVLLTRTEMLRDEARSVDLRRVKNEEMLFLLPALQRVDFLPRLATPKRRNKKGAIRCGINLLFSDAVLSNRLESAVDKQKLSLDGAFLGMTKSFLISVSPQGNVEICTPMDEVELPKVEAYVRNLKFTPIDKMGKDKLSTIQIVVHKLDDKKEVIK